jgi:hypothetical protein
MTMGLGFSSMSLQPVEYVRALARHLRGRQPD